MKREITVDSAEWSSLHEMLESITGARWDRVSAVKMRACALGPAAFRGEVLPVVVTVCVRYAGAWTIHRWKGNIFPSWSTYVDLIGIYGLAIRENDEWTMEALQGILARKEEQ